ncbi:hypothetical protein [Streptomyces sp. NPDC002530]
MTNTTRKLLTETLKRLNSNPEEWTSSDTETLSRLRAAAEWEEAAERVVAARNGVRA